MLGPVLMGALICALWVDHLLDHAAMPGWFATIWSVLTGADAPATMPPGLALLALGLVICPMAAREFAAICRAGHVEVRDWWLAFAAVSGLLMFAIVPVQAPAVSSASIVATGATIVLVGSILLHTRHKQTHGATAAAGAALFSFIYLGLMFGFVLALRREQSAWVVLGVLMVTKSCDIGAFFTGKAIGKHKLIPWLSPGKTWEGLVGGVVTAALTAVGLVALARATGLQSGVIELAWWQAAGAGVAFAVTGQAGDLFASVLKRDAGLKDSGRSLPGFGGVLDVVDSVLLVAPVAYWAIGRL
jgi:phosphatidate cytidylyltransferase